MLSNTHAQTQLLYHRCACTPRVKILSTIHTTVAAGIGSWSAPTAAGLGSNCNRGLFQPGVQGRHCNHGVVYCACALVFILVSTKISVY